MRVYVRTRDSLGHVVAEYYTDITRDRYDYLKAEAEETDDGSLVAVYDLEVEGELGWREIYL